MTLRSYGKLKVALIVSCSTTTTCHTRNCLMWCFNLNLEAFKYSVNIKNWYGLLTKNGCGINLYPRQLWPKIQQTKIAHELLPQAAVVRG